MARFPVTLHDDVWTDTLLDVVADLLEKLSSKEDDTGSAVSDLRVLCTCNVDESTRSRVDDVEKLENGSAVVGDLSLSSLVHDELVHAAGAERASEGLCDGETRGDV